MDDKFELATFDCETDPFEHGAEIEPFCCGLKVKDTYMSFWGLDCFEQCDEYLKGLTADGIRLLIYAHNGGKFDWIYLIRKGLIDTSKVMIVNSRIVRAYWRGHEIRDSYSIIPCALSKMLTSAGIKQDMDYNKMKINRRDNYQGEILNYLMQDCIVLYSAVEEFIDTFGLRLTIGGTAMHEIKKTVSFKKQDKHYDRQIRPYYMGGRVGAFHIGKIPAGYKYYDVNSLYPSTMASVDHFCGENLKRHKIKGKHGIHKALLAIQNPYLIKWEGYNNAACAIKCEKTKATTFDLSHGIFLSTSHEINVALKYGLIDVKRVHELIECRSPIRFDEFVNKFARLKEQAKRNQDGMREILFKILLNSGYGKFGQWPEAFCDYEIITVEAAPFYLSNGWGLRYDYEDFMVVSKPSADETGYFDVGVAASITGAARAVLLDGLMRAKMPIYCDTDSIIARDFPRALIDPYKMGYWDCETDIAEGYIAGKKMYALKNSEGKIKTSTKGVRLNFNEVKSLVETGNSVRWKSEAPTSSLDGTQWYQTRNVSLGRENKRPKPLW